MKRKTLLILSVLLVTFLTVATVFAQTFPDAGTSVSNAVLQNESATSATVTVEYYAPDGTLQYTDDTTVGAKAVIEVKAADAPLPAGFAGAAVVSSDQPLASVVSIKNANVTASAGTTTQSAYNGTSAPNTTLRFPSVWRYSGSASTVSIQNTENSATIATASFFDRDGNSLGSATIDLEAYGSYTIDMRNIGLSGVNWPDSVADGSISVTAANTLAGASTAAWSNRAGAYQALTGDNEGTVLYAPSHFRVKGQSTGTQFDLFSAVNIQNTDSATDAPITAEYFTRGDVSGVPALTINTTVPAGSAIGLNTKNGASVDAALFNALGEDWDGSVKITSDDAIPLVGTGISSWGRKGYTGIYALVSGNNASDTIYIPAQYRRQASGVWKQWSAVNLQNIGDSTVNASDITITFLDTSGATVTSFTGADLPGDLVAGAAFGLNTRNGGDLDATDMDPLGTGFIGGIVVEGPIGSKLVAVNNIVYDNRSSVYNGVPK